MTCGHFLFTSSMYICIRGRTVIYHKVMLWIILSKISMFSVIIKISILEPSWKVWSVKASNTSNLPCFSLVFLISCEMNWEVMVNHLSVPGKMAELHHSLWAFCNFSTIAILLQRFHEQMLYQYRSKVPQLVDATDREN